MRHRYAWMATAVLIVGLSTAWIFRFKLHHASSDPPFTVAKVERGDIIQSVATTGQLTPRVSVEVSSQISGLLIEVAADFNLRVKKGQVLARVDPSTYEQALQQAQANLIAAQAIDALAGLNVKRLEDLFMQDLVTQQE